MKNFVNILLTALAIFVMGGAFAEATGQDPGASQIVVASAAATADFSTLHAYAGKFEQTLIKQMLNKMDVAQDLHLMRGLRAARKLPKIVINSGIRPLNTAVTDPKSVGRTFSSREIVPREAMKIMRVIPDEYRDTFMAEQLEPGAKREPFAAYVWRLEFEKIASEINDNFYHMKYNADAPVYSASATYEEGDYINFNHAIYICVDDTDAGQSPTTHEAKWEDVSHLVICNGLGTVIQEIIDNDEIPGDNIALTGPITDDDACDQFEMMYRSMPSRYRGKVGTIYCSHNSADSYVEHFKTKYPNSTVVNEKHGDAPLYLYRSAKQVIIKPVSWMGESQRLIFSNKENLIFGTDELGQTSKISKVIDDLHGYSAVVKWIMNSQVRDTEVLWINDQA